MEDIRTGLKALAVLTLWAASFGAFLWIDTYRVFFTVIPRNVQIDLLGAEVATLPALRQARNDCCMFPLPDGYMEWTYALPADVAAKLRARCARLEQYGGVDGACVAGRRAFGPDGINGSAEAHVSPDGLRLTVTYL